MIFLIIVESPSKIQKIQKILNNEYPSHTFKMASSVGHITELSKIKMGVDIKKNFKPNWIECKNKKKVIQNLKNLKKQVDKVLIASDLDTEGEKIAYDIANILKLNINEKNRLIFNEITKKAIIKSFNNPVKININLVHSQFTRRILDRLIGFEISSITAKEIQRGVSAGRVLSITTKLIYDREQEIIKSQNDNTYHEIYADFKSEKYTLKKTLYSKKLNDEDSLKSELNIFKKSHFTVQNIQSLSKRSSPPMPFITSSINQASPYSIKQTTMILQKLYQKGYITYIRTDSTRISDTAKLSIKDYIIEKFSQNTFYDRTDMIPKKKIQDAHEAIRPTNILMESADIKNLNERRVYELIWKRTIAYFMKDSLYLLKDIIINVSNVPNIFNKKIKEFTYIGWKQIYTTLNELNKEVNNIKDIEENDSLIYEKIYTEHKYNTTVGRYTESNLVKTLEKLGIGRPSTYASAVLNIQNKNYVLKKNIEGKKVLSLHLILQDNKIYQKYKNEVINSEKNKLILTELGEKVTIFLNTNFSSIMNYNFTSDIENDLDKIKINENVWYNIIKKYYDLFHPQVIKNKLHLKNKRKESNDFIGSYKNKNFYRFQSQYGPRIIYGEKQSKDVLYLVPQNKMLLSKITLNDAIKLLPVNLGKYNKKDILLCFSKNYYFKCNKRNYPLHWSKKNKSSEDITYEDAILSILEYNKKLENKKYSVVQLKKIAKEKKIKGYSKMKKNDLLKVLGIQI